MRTPKPEVKESVSPIQPKYFERARMSSNQDWKAEDVSRESLARIFGEFNPEELKLKQARSSLESVDLLKTVIQTLEKQKLF